MEALSRAYTDLAFCLVSDVNTESSLIVKTFTFLCWDNVNLQVYIFGAMPDAYT